MIAGSLAQPCDVMTSCKGQGMDGFGLVTFFMNNSRRAFTPSTAIRSLYLTDTGFHDSH